MKIIIIGAGRIGRNLAKTLASENNEVYLIDKSEEVARRLSEKLDVKFIVGNAVDPDTLMKAQVEHADLVLAVTTSDETNLVVSALAGMHGAKRRIARVRNTSLSRTLDKFGYKQFYIDEVINPELVAAQTIVKTIQTPGASEVAEFAEGRILLRGFDIPATSSIVGMDLGSLRDEDFPWPFVIVSILREGQVIIPKGDTCIEAEDHIYALLPKPSLAEFLTFINPDIKLPKKVIVYGASITGRHVAEALSAFISDILLIEEDSVKAKEMASELHNVRIINGSAGEAEILVECGVEAADAFIAASKNDHSNLISSVLAKKMGAKTTIITTQQPDYLTLVNALDIDAIINPHYLAVEQILHLVRGKGIISVTKLSECDAEALEFIPEEDSPITKDPIKKINFPKQAIIGAVYSGDEVILANGDTQINAGEKVIVFCQPEAVKKLQKMFVRSKLF